MRSEAEPRNEGYSGNATQFDLWDTPYPIGAKIRAASSPEHPPLLTPASPTWGSKGFERPLP